MLLTYCTRRSTPCSKWTHTSVSRAFAYTRSSIRTRIWITRSTYKEEIKFQNKHARLLDWYIYLSLLHSFGSLFKLPCSLKKSRILYDFFILYNKEYCPVKKSLTTSWRSSFPIGRIPIRLILTGNWVCHCTWLKPGMASISQHCTDW